MYGLVAFGNLLGGGNCFWLAFVCFSALITNAAHRFAASSFSPVFRCNLHSDLAIGINMVQKSGYGVVRLGVHEGMEFGTGNIRYGNFGGPVSGIWLTRNKQGSRHHFRKFSF